jgi:hypothetical protein
MSVGTKEISKKTGVSMDYIHSLLKAGKLLEFGHFKDGQKIAFPKESEYPVIIKILEHRVVSSPRFQKRLDQIKSEAPEVKKTKKKPKRKGDPSRAKTTDRKKYPLHECSRPGCGRMTDYRFLCTVCQKEHAGECGEPI